MAAYIVPAIEASHIDRPTVCHFSRDVALHNDANAADVFQDGLRHSRCQHSAASDDDATARTRGCNCVSG